MDNTIWTCELVTPKHPDKICDQISDAILDDCLKQDPLSRVAIEVMGGHGVINIMGEITTHADVDLDKIVERIAGSGYKINTYITNQSEFISQGVDNGGAGDQGIMVGYACNETPELMPLEYIYARSLCQFIYDKYPYDGKVQVTVSDGEITTIIASFQNVSAQDLKNLVTNWVNNNLAILGLTDLDAVRGGTESQARRTVKYGEHRDEDSNEEMRQIHKPYIYANPAGDWSSGGFEADTGLTGRKIIIDAYGPRVPVGGGAFSGKDGTKVDRSGAYMARKIAIDYLKARKAQEVYVYLAYGIGLINPLQSTVVIDGIEEEIQGYDLTPRAIIDFLDLRQPQFEETARWGHFGNNKFKWEQ